MSTHGASNASRIKTVVTDTSLDVRAVWNLHSWTQNKQFFIRVSVRYTDEYANCTLLEHTAQTLRPKSVLNAYSLVWHDAKHNSGDPLLVKLLERHLKALARSQALLEDLEGPKAKKGTSKPKGGA